MKTLIHKQARERLAELLPGLDNYPCGCPREDHWAMLRLFLFNPYIDHETGAVRLGAEAVARAVNQLDKFQSGHFNAGKYINHFINFIIPGIATLLVDEEGREWSTASWDDSNGFWVKTEEGKQRRALVNWPEEIKEVVYNETHGLYTDEKVYIVSGNKRNEALERRGLKAKIEECNNVIELAACPTAKYIAKYHHSLPVNTFNKITENADAARALIDSMPNENARNQQMMVLEAVLECPKPTYKPTERSDRLFGFGANITQLKKEVRRALTKDWVEFDLRSAQLAIISKIWNIPELAAFLESGRSYWKELATYLGLVLTDSVKDTLKRATYALVFGMSKRNLIDLVATELGESVGEAYIHYPLVSTILKARTRYMEKVLEIGYIVDPFFKVHQVSKRNLLSIIAREAQAYEQVLLYPVYQLTNETDDFSITLLQHDGISVKFHDTKTEKYWINRICEVVKETANSIGIPTYLEYEKNTSKHVGSIVTLENVCIGEYSKTTTNLIEESGDLYNHMCPYRQMLRGSNKESFKQENYTYGQTEENETSQYLPSENIQQIWETSHAVSSTRRVLTFSTK